MLSGSPVGTENGNPAYRARRAKGTNSQNDRRIYHLTRGLRGDFLGTAVKREPGAPPGGVENPVSGGGEPQNESDKSEPSRARGKLFCFRSVTRNARRTRTSRRIGHRIFPAFPARKARLKAVPVSAAVRRGDFRPRRRRAAVPLPGSPSCPHCPASPTSLPFPAPHRGLPPPRLTAPQLTPGNPR